MTTIYCLDSSVFINSWTKYYPLEVFPCVWDLLDDLMYSKRAFIPHVVYEEVHKGQDDLLRWLEFYMRESVVKPDLEHIKATKAIVQAHPKLLETKKNRSGSGGDPWIIACAQVLGAVVVTDERASNELKKPKIPDVCKALGIGCIPIVQLLKDCGLRAETPKPPPK